MSLTDEAAHVDHRLKRWRDAMLAARLRFGAHPRAEMSFRAKTRPTVEGDDIEVTNVSFLSIGSQRQVTVDIDAFKEGEMFIHSHPDRGMPEFSNGDDELACKFARFGVGFAVTDAEFRYLSIARLPSWEKPVKLPPMRIAKIGPYRVGLWRYTT